MGGISSSTSHPGRIIKIEQIAGEIVNDNPAVVAGLNAGAIFQANRPRPLEPPRTLVWTAYSALRISAAAAASVSRNSAAI